MCARVMPSANESKLKWILVGDMGALGTLNALSLDLMGDAGWPE